MSFHRVMDEEYKKPYNQVGVFCPAGKFFPMGSSIRAVKYRSENICN
jgi:hypothetical protein